MASVAGPAATSRSCRPATTWTAVRRCATLLDFLMTLEAQAAAGGGRAIVLMGNHEASNAIGDLRDVPASRVRRLRGRGVRGPARSGLCGAREARRGPPRGCWPGRTRRIPIPKVYHGPGTGRVDGRAPAGLRRIPRGVRAARHLRQVDADARWSLVRIDDTVFLHGGINPEVAPKKLESLNEQAQKEIARWDRMRKLMIDQQIALPSFTFEELLEAGGSELPRVAVEARRRLGLGRAAGSGGRARRRSRRTRSPICRSSASGSSSTRTGRSGSAGTPRGARRKARRGWTSCSAATGPSGSSSGTR